MDNLTTGRHVTAIMRCHRLPVKFTQLLLDLLGVKMNFYFNFAFKHSGNTFVILMVIDIVISYF